MKVATIILNRNLKQATDKLCNHLLSFDTVSEDLFVIDAGSDSDKISEFTTWTISDDEVRMNGLRFNRGMNQALLNLYQDSRWYNYDAFFLLTNDTQLSATSTISPLTAILNDHHSLGVVTPCSQRWGEIQLIPENSLKYSWFMHSNVLLVRRLCAEDLINTNSPTRNNFLFDGNNFRGYLSETEFIAKCYVNDWAAAITRTATCDENESFLKNNSNLIKTDTVDINLKLYLDEGLAWAQEKYGFKSRWDMNLYAKLFYDEFFRMNPSLRDFSII
jgi:hypothetical protein